jgi:hypothetical protein
MSLPQKKRLTKAQKAERAAFTNSEERARKMIRDKIDRAIALRSKERNFHGLEREFLYYQEDMLRLYSRAKDSKHPRDIGLAREQIVRNFLVDTGLLPARYALATTSVRVASTTGHGSAELDLLFYDPIDSISLMRREDAYQILPVESTYGTIQVKSKATRKDIIRDFRILHLIKVSIVYLQLRGLYILAGKRANKDSEYCLHSIQT